MAYLGLLLAVVLDQTVRLLSPFGAPLPDLPLITALYIGFRARDTGQLGYAVALGVLADCFSAHPVGHFAFLYGATAYVALRLRRYVPPDAFVSHVVACLFCGLVGAFLALLLAAATTRGLVGSGFSRALLVACASAPLAPVVFGVWDRSRFFGRVLGGHGYEFA